LLVALAVLIGGAFSILLVFIRHGLKQRQTDLQKDG